MLGAAGALPTARAPPRCAAGSAGAGTGARREGRRRQGGRRQRRGGGRGGSGHSGSKGGNGAVPKDVAAWRIFGVEVSPEDDPGKDEYGVSEELLCALQARLGANAPPDAATCRVARKSVDARRGKRPTFSYVVDVSLDGLRTCGARRLRAGPRQQPLSAEDVSAAAFCAADVRESSAGSPGDADSHPEDDVQTSVAKDVVVIGAGPAGLFAALELAEAAAAARGSNVRIRLLERGKGVEKRGRSIGALFSRRVLDADSNVCYGEGGAGAWSGVYLGAALRLCLARARARMRAANTPWSPSNDRHVVGWEAHHAHRAQRCVRTARTRDARALRCARAHPHVGRAAPRHRQPRPIVARIQAASN